MKKLYLFIIGLVSSTSFSTARYPEFGQPQSLIEILFLSAMCTACEDHLDLVTYEQWAQ